METITLTKKRIQMLLPENIRKSTVMSKNAKKVLAAILNYFVTLDKAKDNGYVYLSNVTLRETVEMGQNQMLNAIQELIELGLIKRERGEKWSSGKPKSASKYYVYTKKLYEPLVMPTDKELLALIPDASSTTVKVKDIVKVLVEDKVEDKEKDEVLKTVKKTVEDKNNLLYSDHNDQLDNKENILNNKINIIDNITVCEGEEPSSTDGDTNNKQQTDTPMTESNNSNDQQDIIPAYAQSAYAQPTLRLILNNIKKASKCKDLLTNHREGLKLIGKDDKQGRLTLLQLSHNTIVNSPELQAGIKETENEKDLQLLTMLQGINRILISEEEARAWYNSNVNKC